MSDIVRTIEDEDVQWEMDWSGENPDGSRKHPDKPEKEMRFEREPALALMLANEVVYLNSHWWRDDWSAVDKGIPSLSVNCNDVFMWGCADGEGLPFDQIQPLYEMWRKDPAWGPAVWCLIQRRQMPQRAVEKRIRAAGIWDLDALKLEYALQENVGWYDHLRICPRQHP